MELTFEVSLRHLATIAAADSLWRTEGIVNKTKTYFLSPTQYGKLQMWDSLTKAVLNQVDPRSLPAILYTEVVYAATILGHKRRDWFRFCRMRNIFRDVPKEELYEHYLRNVSWTYYGTVDEEKIIRSWFQNPNCNLWKVYVMASCFCSEEFVKEVWMEVKKIYSPKHFEKLCGSKRYGWHMAAYWNRYFSNNLENFISDIWSNWDLDFYNLERPVEENMLKLCVCRGYTKAAKRFWFMLDDQNKIVNLKRWCYKTVDSICNGSHSLAKFYKYDHFVQIFLLALKDISGNPEVSIINMINDYQFFQIIDHLTCWPWVKLVIPIVNFSKEFLNEGAYKTLCANVSYEAANNKSCFMSKDNIVHRVLMHLLNMVPQDYKATINEAIMSSLFSAWDVTILKKVLNDTDFFPNKGELQFYHYHAFETFVQEGNQGMIKEFISLLIPTKWEKSIQQNFKLIYQHILNCDFDAADEILNSLSQSDQELSGFKNKIDHYLICCYFVKKKQLDNMDKFLHWKFNSKQLESAYKQSFFNGDILVKYYLDFWDTDKENIEEAKLQSDQFLVWLFNDKYTRDFFLKNFGENFWLLDEWAFKTKRYEVMNDIMEWCSLNEGEKNWVRYGSSSINDVEMFDTMGIYMEKNQWEIAQKHLNFVFQSEKKKMAFMRKFLKAEHSVFHCKLFISKTCGASSIFDAKPSHKDILKNMKEFIRFWMKPIKVNKRHGLKTALKNWPKASMKMLQNEKKLSDNTDSDDCGEIDGEGTLHYSQHHNYIYCDESNLNMFLELLQEFDESEDGQF